MELNYKESHGSWETSSNTSERYAAFELKVNEENPSSASDVRPTWPLASLTVNKIALLTFKMSYTA